jgi:hypothetical protein
MLDFTLSYYKNLCLNLRGLGYNFLTLQTFVMNEKSSEKKKCIVMRHDVDRFPRNALKMAILENKLGIVSTYYFRHIPSVFKKDIILEIFNMGHEIGYHYETLAKTRGNISQAIKLFEKELNDFRALVPVSTICMHGSPLSPYDNRDLWKNYDFRNYDITAEPYLSLSYENIAYFTDTARTWGESALNFRDQIPHRNVNKLTNNIHLTTTESLINYIAEHLPPQLILQSHPERWAHSMSTYSLSFSLDILSGFIKKCINLMRHQ